MKQKTQPTLPSSTNSNHGKFARHTTSLSFDLPEGQDYRGEIATVRAQSCVSTGCVAVTICTEDGRSLHVSFDHISTRALIFELREVLAICDRLELNSFQVPEPSTSNFTIQVSFAPHDKYDPPEIFASLCFRNRQVWLIVKCEGWTATLFLNLRVAAALIFDFERANADLEKWSAV